MIGEGGKCKMNGKWYKHPGYSVWWEKTDQIGLMIFSFDAGVHAFNFFTDFPQMLTPEQVRIFKKEYPTLANLKD